MRGFFVFCIEIYILTLVLMLMGVIDLKITRKKIIILCIISILGVFLLYKYFDYGYFFIEVSLFLTFSKGKLYKRILWFAEILLSVFMLDFIVADIMIAILKIPGKEINTDNVTVISAAIMFCGMTVVFLLLKNKQKKIYEIMNSISGGYSVYLIISIIVCIFLASYTQVCLRGYEISKGKNLLAICMLLFGVSEVILCITLQKLNLTKKELEILNISNQDYIEKQKEYLQTINEKNTEIRKFRHDYKEHIYVIEGLLSEKKYDDLESYIKQLSDIKEKLDYINVGNDIVNAVLNHYNEIMKKKNITFSCRGKIPQKIETISETALCGIFSNIVKNAIEATEKTDSKNIQLTLSCHNEIKIRLENDALCPETEDGKLISDKNDRENHGIGIMNVKKYVEDAGGLFNWEYKDKKFIVKIVLMDSH